MSANIGKRQIIEQHVYLLCSAKHNICLVYLWNVSCYLGDIHSSHVKITQKKEWETNKYPYDDHILQILNQLWLDSCKNKLNNYIYNNYCYISNQLQSIDAVAKAVVKNNYFCYNVFRLTQIKFLILSHLVQFPVSEPCKPEESKQIQTPQVNKVVNVNL